MVQPFDLGSLEENVNLGDYCFFLLFTGKLKEAFSYQIKT